MNYVWAVQIVPNETGIPNLYSSKKKAVAYFNEEIEWAKKCESDVILSDDHMSATLYHGEVSMQVIKLYIM